MITNTFIFEKRRIRGNYHWKNGIQYQIGRQTALIKASYAQTTTSGIIMTRNALLVTGARQIGKTYSIRQFGKSFKSFVEINFIEMPEAVELFKGAKSSGDMLLRLSALTSVPLIKGETLVFSTRYRSVPRSLRRSNSLWTKARTVISSAVRCWGWS